MCEGYWDDVGTLAAYVSAHKDILDGRVDVDVPGFRLDGGIWLGEGIASIAAVLDPAVVAIGGGVAEAEDLLLGPARRAFEAQLTGRGHRPMLDIRKATLGNEAGLIGAADLARK